MTKCSGERVARIWFGSVDHARALFRIFLSVGRRFLALCLLLAFSIPAAQAYPDLVFNVDSDGRLRSVTNVLLDYNLYEVRFDFAFCNAVIGCYPEFLISADISGIYTAEQANRASEALITQVLVDGAAGDFDSIPSILGVAVSQLGLGCTSPVLCKIFTPYAIASNGELLASVVYSTASAEDSYQLVQGTHTDLFPSTSNITVAQWRGLPEPSSVALVCSAIGLLLLNRRRRQRIASYNNRAPRILGLTV